MSATDRLSPTRPAWPLVILLALALFPLGWLGEVYRPLGELLGTYAGTARAHAVAHAAIFFVLGAALMACFPAVRARPLRYFGLLLLAAACQELFQLAYKQRPLAFDDLRDIVTDVVGMAAAYGLMLLLRLRAPAAGRGGRR